MVAACNFCLFLIVATWSFLPLYIVEMGGSQTDVGIVMGSLGITSLGALPLIGPLIDRCGRKFFIIIGAFVAGASNLAYLAFDSFSLWFVAARLLQGLAFASCFNACVTAVVDLAPPEKRGQAIGWFGVSGSLAFAAGPYLGEETILNFGFSAYFILLFAFGTLGAGLGLMIAEPKRRTMDPSPQGFFGTAIRADLAPMIAIAITFGACFASMITFFPLYAASIGLRAGFFFMAYGAVLVIVRLFWGRLTDVIRREKIIFGCFAGFAVLLICASRIFHILHTIALGCGFGIIQALCYPAMMARMVDRSDETNRAVVVSLFTGSMGLGINLSAFGWGYIADIYGLPVMYALASGFMSIACAIMIRSWRSILF